eukprot:TRINITY_DN30415_c0_g1_i1.p2 TRINITY_DN30415_c0_g1~~TRINITY_DN30415_c0_g1_i1.p2  ORF type:complete len:124 (+),score=3.29 TRINITY_DN30415_c0_g1_i1:1-372(+)
MQYEKGNHNGGATHLRSSSPLLCSALSDPGHVAAAGSGIRKPRTLAPHTTPHGSGWVASGCAAKLGRCSGEGRGRFLVCLLGWSRGVSLQATLTERVVVVVVGKEEGRGCVNSWLAGIVCVEE